MNAQDTTEVLSVEDEAACALEIAEAEEEARWASLKLLRLLVLVSAVVVAWDWLLNN